MPEIPTQGTTNTSVDNTSALIQSILASALQAPPPQATPAVAQAPQVDVAALLQQLLNPPPPPAPAPKTWKDKLGSVVQSLGQGVAVATSSDPGRVLNQQIGDRQQQAFALRQQADARQEKLADMNRQFGMQIMGQQIGEQADIRKEGRQQGYKAEDRKAEEDLLVKRFNMELTGKEKMENLSASNNLNLAKIQNGWQDERLKQTQGWQEHMSDLERTDKKLYEQVNTSLGLIKTGVDAGRATTIAKKWMNDQELTKDEAKAVNAAVQRQARLAAGGGGGRSSGSGGAKDAWKMAQEFAKGQYVQLQDGSIVEYSSVPKTFDGQVDQSTIAHRLSPAEAATYAMQKVYPAALGAITGQDIKGQAPQPTDAGLQTQGINHWTSQIKAAYDAQLSDTQIKKMLQEQITAQPQQKDLIEAAAVKAGLLKAPHAFKPKTDEEAKRLLNEKRKKETAAGARLEGGANER